MFQPRFSRSGFRSGSPICSNMRSGSPFRSNFRSGSPMRSNFRSGSPFRSNFRSGSPFRSSSPFRSGSPFPSNYRSGSPFRYNSRSGSPFRSNFRNWSPFANDCEDYGRFYYPSPYSDDRRYGDYYYSDYASSARQGTPWRFGGDYGAQFEDYSHRYLESGARGEFGDYAWQSGDYEDYVCQEDGAQDRFSERRSRANRPQYGERYGRQYGPRYRSLSPAAYRGQRAGAALRARSMSPGYERADFYAAREAMDGGWDSSRSGMARHSQTVAGERQMTSGMTQRPGAYRVSWCN
ncbi:hypothetical protein FJT64_022528 [Amphibalanus amphitrite]|uniref:Uncharacterized protein n=1 Tax=Amphibalanus amphitrite TaxID=1232801 RepID=A0A6A4WUF6_AMPAM|nr:hypothetical protein FJT64_022528 [Amphibalanus amphitrite]